MSATNDVTGDALVTKKTNDAYRDGWDRIFGKKKPHETGTDVPPDLRTVDTRVRGCSVYYGSGRDLNDLPCVCGCPDRS